MTEEFDLSKKIKSNEAQKGICKVPDWIEVSDVKEFIRLLKKRDKEVILWTRQWAEYVDDEKILDMWDRKVGMEIFIGKNLVDSKEVTDLDKLAGSLAYGDGK